MSRGYYLEIAPIESTGDCQHFSVIADGWDGVSRKQPVNVGRLSIFPATATYTFTPSGEWADGSVVSRVISQPLIKENGHYVFHSWLIQAATNWLEAGSGRPRLAFYI